MEKVFTVGRFSGRPINVTRRKINMAIKPMQGTYDSFFLILWALLLGIEGDESNDPVDRGGHTKWGVTEKAARAWGYEGNMTDFTKELSKQFYWEVHWKPLRLSEIAQISKEVTEELFEASVNCGAPRAALWLQKSLNLLNRNKQDYPDIDADSNIGPVTINSLAAFLQKRALPGKKVLLTMLNNWQGNHYMTFGTEHPEQEKWMFGWFLQRVVVKV
jgi:lysozyme family protein